MLFLDELPEFHRDVLEALRQPLEEGEVTVARSGGTLHLPARFQLVCAMNPCRCGWRGHPSGRCTCSDREVEKYVEKISGPLLDRIDLHVSVPSHPDGAVRRHRRHLQRPHGPGHDRPVLLSGRRRGSADEVRL